MQVSTEVLAVLSTLEIDGDLIRMQKLERALYLKTDQVLQAMGGKWNRKAKAHVFEVDPKPLIEQVIALGEVTTHKDLGFFRTPEPLAIQLVELADVQPAHWVLEPSAGDGVIVDIVQGKGACVVAIERDVSRRERLWSRRAALHDWAQAVWVERDVSDFMDYAPQEPFDRVVMNPPFLKCGLGDHLDHVRHAFSMLVPGGVLVSVLPKGVDFRRDKRHDEFRRWAYDICHATTGDGDASPTSNLPDDAFKESGTSVRTVVLRLVKP